jgi:hypothetical protein
MARIVVTGYMIRHPLAGNMLAYFHYVMGLHRLGHDVCYLEESGWSNSCYNPEQGDYSDDPSYGVGAVGRLMALHGVNAPVCYVNRDTGESVGIGPPGVKQLLASSDLLLNLGGICALPEFALSPRRILVDMDPLFTQLGCFAAEDLESYDEYFTYGTNVGQPGCGIPTRGLDWRATVPPVVPEIWRELTTGPPHDRTAAPFSTVCNWNAYGSVTYAGERYGQKDEEFLRLRALPRYTSQPLELAVSGASEELIEQFRELGWSIRNAEDISADPASYKAYIEESRAEFSVAKQAYVKSRSGWISDRSVCYLASGRPVIVQDTGIGNWLPTGLGLLLFSTLEEAVAGIDEINSAYTTHREAACELAQEYFSASRVLPRLIDRAVE